MLRAHKILLVEDDPDLREALLDTLELANISVVGVCDGESAVIALKSDSYDLVITDVNMPGMDGHALLEYIRKNYMATPVILMTAYGEIDKAVEAMRHGAADYLLKPFESAVLIDTIKSYAIGSDSQNNVQTIACSPGSQQLLTLAKRVAVTDSTVLITGESGTGKEVLARYIHQNSARCEQAFIAINCAAIPENMLESILFGHEKGAFTGAVAASAGKFEQANGGTLLLDEVTEMPLGLQAKLLRVLQEQEVERIGSKHVIKLDVRVLATTNRSLEEYVAQKQFREDLYYRLNVFPLQWLPLRSRTEDIIPLAQQILIKHSRKMGRADVSFNENAKNALLSYTWPGNVRELDNVIQRALIIQQGNVIYQEDLHLQTGPISINAVELSDNGNSLAAVSLSENSEKHSGNLGSDLRQHEFQLIIDVLRETKGSRKDAAIKLDISPRTLRYKLAKIREAGIDLDQLLKQS